MTAQNARGGVIEHRIGSTGFVALATASGSVDVRATDGDSVRIATARPDDAALLDRFEVEAGDGMLRVRSPRGAFIGLDVFGRRFGWGPGVGELDLVVEMPRSASLELATISGDVHVVGTVGPQRYRTVSGDLKLESVAGPIEIDTTSGNVSLDASSPASLRVRTVSGDVAASAPLLRRFDATTMSGDIGVEAAFEAGPEHTIETVSGDVRLVAHSGLTIETRSITGVVRSDTPHRTGGGRGLRAIVVGDGRAQLRFRSLSGDLQLVGRDASAVAPEGSSWRGSVETPAAPAAPATPRSPAPIRPPLPGGALAPATPPAPDVAADPHEAARLEILHALAAGEIDVAAATERLAGLDAQAQT
jgi:hypothetical protein